MTLFADSLLPGHVAVVTGGASGIGAGTVRALAARGMAVAVADIDIDGAQAVADAVANEHRSMTLAMEVDVVETDSVERLAESVADALGPVHLLFNNAGVMPVGPLLENTIDDWRWLFDVNVIGVVNGINAFVPRMLAHGQPSRVVNTASMAAFGPSEAFPSYAASKQAALGLTESLRLELEGTTVRVSVVCPGAVNTEIAQSERNRQARYGPPSGRTMPIGPEQEKAARQLIEPDEAGRRIVEGILADEFWIFTHPEWTRKIRSRFDEAVDAAQRAIRRRESEA